MPPKLSVAIITLNEEINLGRTLASVQFADEIILVDSGSTDRTVEIAASFRANVFHEPWRGFAAQKNFALERCTGSWILSLDADEALTPELQIEIRALLLGDPAADAYLIRRRNVFLGRWIRHGGYYPDPKLRLFRRHAANFAPPSRFAAGAVHEIIALDGILETLDSDLVHHAYPSIDSYLDHLNHYSSLGAQIILERARPASSTMALVYNVLLHPALTFLQNYLLRLGFLDGREGFLLHLYHSCYSSWQYAKAWQATRKP
jgi:glycosyltransferase involved in cell wall biosynthesis